jgi:hypothetical protein
MRYRELGDVERSRNLCTRHVRTLDYVNARVKKGRSWRISAWRLAFPTLFDTIDLYCEQADGPQLANE